MSKFSDLDIDNKIKEALCKMNMVNMTPIQAKSIQHMLDGKDLMGAAKTGSGKTLAFLVPLVNKLLKNPLRSHNGTMAIILSPTRELSQQIYGILQLLIADTYITSALMVGGKNRKLEAKSLHDHFTVIVATPGRLKDHLYNTEHFVTHKLQTLIIDEADKLMAQGFFDEMHAIVKRLPSFRQTVLFSATLKIDANQLRTEMKQLPDRNIDVKKASIDEKVMTLASLSLKKNCINVDISKEDLLQEDGLQGTSTVAQLKQSYIVVEPHHRFIALYTFLIQNENKKIMIFMSTALAVKYFTTLLNLMCVPALQLHGKMKQAVRDSSFLKFKEMKIGVMVCTDVAARGLDIPLVDWVIQYDPPGDVKEYIHRVGRTARAGHAGQALIFVRPHELGFLTILTKNKIPIMEMMCMNIAPMQDQLETIVESHPDLKLCAEAAFASVTKAYNVYRQRTCFDINQLDFKALAKSFALRKSPPIIPIVSMKSKKRKHSSNADYSKTVKMPKKELE